MPRRVPPLLRLVASSSSPAKPRPDLLPATYAEAKANAICTRVDECKGWADKALALASYAKQMKDESLPNMATKICDRAIRRGGQLLLKVKAQNGGDRRSKGTQAPFDRQTAAREAGLSPHQAKSMIRVANVPDAKFEALVETDRPASIKQLAAFGTKKTERVKPVPYRDEWIDWTAAVKHLSALPACGLDVLASRTPYEIDRLRDDCAEALRNLDLWRQTLEKSHGRSKAKGNPG